MRRFPIVWRSALKRALLAFFFLFAAIAGSTAYAVVDAPKTLLVPIEGPVYSGLASFVNRVLGEAGDADTIIFRINRLANRIGSLYGRCRWTLVPVDLKAGGAQCRWSTLRQLNTAVFKKKDRYATFCLRAPRHGVGPQFLLNFDCDLSLPLFTGWNNIGRHAKHRHA